MNKPTMNATPNITVIILSYNEEVNIRFALDSVRWCDNVIVVDSFSTDQTSEICREYENVVFLQHPFTDFASQRQYGMESGCVAHDWILALDADEQVTDLLKDELAGIAANSSAGDPIAYDIAMRLVMWGKWLRFSSEYPVYWRRFFLAERGHFVQEGHADKLVADGPVARTKSDLVHNDRHDLSHWLAKHNQYSTKEAQFAISELQSVPWSDIFSTDRAKRRKALKRLFRSIPCSDTVRFVYLYLVRLGFLDGWRGYRYAKLKSQQAYHVSLKIEELRSKGCVVADPEHSKRVRDGKEHSLVE